jgi:hypothetical protein
MTTVSASSSYASYYQTANTYAARQAGTTASSNGTGTTGKQGGDTIVLSDAAKKALAEKDFATVTADARTALDDLLEAAGRTSPLDANGHVAIDLSKLDRRELYAISSNSDDQFTEDEQAAAEDEMNDRFDAALAGPLAVARVTGDISALYKAASDYLDGASAEEKESDTWSKLHDAVAAAYQQTLSDPDNIPAVDGDPVADYIARSNSGEAGAQRDFDSVASDVRTALDKQYADAASAGKELVFDSGRKIGQLVDFSDFDSRSLSAIVLNQGDRFSSVEVTAAQAELRKRSSATLLAGLKSAGSDPTAFATNIINAFGSMSAEERNAAGWSDAFYDTVLQNYQSAAKIAQMFGASGSGAAATTSSGVMSLLNYL